jgi:Domain of unknown function (DUF4175)
MSGHDNTLRGYLRSILWRTAALHAGSGMVSFLAALSWVLLAVVLWTAIVDTPSLGTATWIARATIALAALLFGYFVVWPIVRMPRLNQLAAEIERRQDLQEMVRAGFEFSQDDRAGQRYSPELVKEVIRRAVEKLSGLQVRSVFLNRRDLALMPIALAGLVVLLGVALIKPAIVTEAGRRVFSPEDVAALPHRPNIYAQPGNATVLAGSDVTVSGLDLGRTETPVQIAYNLSNDFWKSEPTTRTPGVAYADAAFDRYDYTFRDIRNTTSYRFEVGEYKSPTYTITVVHEPILTDVRVTLTPPAYTNEPTTTLDESAGNIQALEGTKVRVEARSNNALRGAWVQFDDKAKQPAAFSGRDLSFEFAALVDGRYRVLLEDSLGFATREPLAYTVEVFQDRAPTVDVLEPGEDTAMPRGQTVDLGFVAADDYGLARASLHWRKQGDEKFRGQNLPLAGQRNKREIAIAHRWDLSSVTLFPGNSIEYFVEVADNNTVTGPGTARSDVYRLTVPTIGEIYDTAREEEDMRTDALENAIEDSRRLSEQLEKIQREYVKTEQMEWSQKKELDRAAETQKAVQDKIEQVKESLDKTMRELSDNEMTSQQIGEKLEEIRQLMEQIDSKELEKYMDELQKAMEKLSPEQIKQALENLQLNTKEMLERLERTASLLKELQKEQRMEELVRQTQDLMEKQADLNEKTSEASEKDSKKMNDLAQQQEELARQADEMQKGAKDLQEQMDDQTVKEELQQMSQEQQGPQQNMRQASKDLQKQQQSPAMQQQQQAMEKMVSLFKRATKAQQMSAQNQGQMMAQNFQKFAKQTLELSHRQESLAGDLKQTTGSEVEMQGLHEISTEQLSYLEATEKVANEINKIASASLSVSPILLQALGDAITRMQSAMLFLEQDKPYMSTTHAHNAVESLNQATIEMLRSAQNCQSGQGGQSMAQQMLQQMIPQQQDVIKETQAMMQMRLTEEALRQQRQSQLDRLAGQQRSLQEIAKQIEQSAKGNRETLGRLDRTIEDMEAVVEALEKGRVDDDLVNKEQRILSRLLDAERSVHTRDYEKKRESVSAEDVFSKSLGRRPDGADAQTLRDEIQRAMQLKAPGEFEDLIRLYFRALADEAPVSTPRSQ